MPHPKTDVIKRPFASFICPHFFNYQNALNRIWNIGSLGPENFKFLLVTHIINSIAHRFDPCLRLPTFFPNLLVKMCAAVIT